jgi:hypothetical protein
MHIYTKLFKVLSLVAVFVLASATVWAQKTDSASVKMADSVAAFSKKADVGLQATGTITDAITGKPLSGISISVFEFSAAITDDKGNFKVRVPSYSAVLIVSGPGFETKELPLKGRKSVASSLYRHYTNTNFVNNLMISRQILTIFWLVIWTGTRQRLMTRVSLKNSSKELLTNRLT